MSVERPAARELEIAAGQLVEASNAVDEWYGRGTVRGRAYVRAGHDAVVGIDQAIAALTQARRWLTYELHQDAIERDVRVDLLLAQVHRERHGDPDPDPSQYPRLVEPAPQRDPALAEPAGAAAQRTLAPFGLSVYPPRRPGSGG